MLKVCVLASTSKGNATFIRVGNDKFLIDAGISARKTKRMLKEIGENIAGLNGIILTHEHQDHITGIKALSQRFNLKFWLTFETYQRIRKKTGNFDADFIEVGEEFQIGKDAKITSYEIQHDAVDPIAYLIKSRDNVPLIGYLNDCGRIDPYLIDGFRGVKILVIEANHSFDLLLQSSYPDILKQRILGPKGHLSNWNAAEFIGATKPSVVFLCHISENNNKPEVALEEIEFNLAHHYNKTLPFFIIVPYDGRSASIQSYK